MIERERQVSGNGIRRFLTDLRQGTDRRAGVDRRRAEAATATMPAERPSKPLDRRTRERRWRIDRRLPLGEQFSWEDTVLLERMVIHEDVHVACPQCEGFLLLGPAEFFGDTPLREIHCTSCRRHTSLVIEAEANA